MDCIKTNNNNRKGGKGKNRMKEKKRGPIGLPSILFLCIMPNELTGDANDGDGETDRQRHRGEIMRSWRGERCGERTSDEGRVGQVVIDKLAPLHQEKCPIFTLTRAVADLRQRLRHQPSAG